MELKKGYKLTEIGLIPEDWEVVCLESVADDKKPWSFAGGPFGSNLKSIHYTNSGIRIIQLQNIGDGIFQDDYKIFTNIKKANDLLSCNIYPGDILLSKMGDPVARACLVPQIADRFLMCSDGIRLAVNERDFSKEYILFYINSEVFRKKAEEVSIGSTRKRISLPTLKKLQLAKPKLSEQQAIASALSDVDELILSLEKLIAKKKNIKLGAMQELLTGKKRLPGFNGEWQHQNITRVLMSNEGMKIGPFGSQLKKEYLLEQGQYKVYGQENVYKNDFLIGNRFINQEKYRQLQSCALMSGDIVVSSMGTIGKCAIVPTGIQSGIMDSHLIRLRIKKEVINPYFLMFLFTPDVELLEQQLKKLSVGGIMDGLSTKIVSSLEISFPDLEEQTAIATELLEMDNEIEALEQKLIKYRNIKQGMMQELLTGRIRLVEKTMAATETKPALLEDKYRSPSHNKEFDEAVVISALSATFGNEQYPMTAFRRQKFAYLLHRYCSGKAEGYGKYAAGPFNPNTAYGGPEKIVQSKGYVKWHKTKTKAYAGFIAGENAAEVMSYFEAWYGKEVLNWLEQFRLCQKGGIGAAGHGGYGHYRFADGKPRNYCRISKDGHSKQ